MPQAPDLFSIVDFYIDDLFAKEDEALKLALDDAPDCRKFRSRPAKRSFCIFWRKWLERAGYWNWARWAATPPFGLRARSLKAAA